jgi:hypothetical protein
MEYLVGLAEKLMERQESKPADELGDDECICS